MSPRTVQAGSRRDTSSIYNEVTDLIISELEQGRVPWVQPWGGVLDAPLGMPHNAATGRRYSGINILILWQSVAKRGFSAQRWLTFRQALGLGGHVRRGESGTTIVFADRFVPDDERRRAERDGDAPAGVPFLKRFTVFNVDQCEGLPAAETPVPTTTQAAGGSPSADALIAATGADLRIGGGEACYSPGQDFIRMPPLAAFFEPLDWYRTALHELGHWTGHDSRLARQLPGSFGSKLYAQEELVAEMTAAFVCATLGITPTLRHSGYIGSWLEVLREDDRAVIRAASAASKAADYLLAFRDELAPCDDAEGEASSGSEAPAPAAMLKGGPLPAERAAYRRTRGRG